MKVNAIAYPLLSARTLYGSVSVDQSRHDEAPSISTSVPCRRNLGARLVIEPGPRLRMPQSEAGVS